MDLTDLGWAEPFQSAFDLLKKENPELDAARVGSAARGSFTLLTSRGVCTAVVAGRLRHQAREESDLPAVGDWVAVQLGARGDAARIEAVLPRATALVRVRPDTSTPQVIAANLHRVFVVCALNQDFNLRRIERYLTLIWSSGAEPVVLLSKADLCPDVTGYRDRAVEVALGAPVHALSALEGQGLDALAPYLARGQTVALVGSSGVGKSTLVNALMGAPRLRTAAIREHDGRGRHTTSHRELFLLDGGALLVDTPGLREVGLWEGDDGVAIAFDHEHALAEQCRFKDCSHVAEPGCALLDAVRRGELSEARHRSYLKLLREAAYVERRADERMRREHQERQRRVYRARRRHWRQHPKR